MEIIPFISDKIGDTIDIFNGIPVNRQYKKRKKTEQRVLYKDTICAFDIETTRLPEIEQSIAYLWQFAFDTPSGVIYCVYGRYWHELKTLFSSITDNNMRSIVFVHNLSYEFQFLRSIVTIPEESVFSIKPRKILKILAGTEESGQLEMRCSYMQTRKSLDKLLSDFGVENQKLHDFDYTKRRYPWTPLSDHELNYGCNDVIGLVQAMRKRMEQGNDTLYSLPLTSTGYVRRMARDAMKKYNYKQLHSMMCNEDVYTLLREEFRGGDTHANRYYTGKILDNLESWDRASSYPDVMLNCKFPMSAFEKQGDVIIDDIDRWTDYGRCYIARFTFYGIKQKDVYYGCPYLSKDKALYYDRSVWDNGRLLNTIDSDGKVIYTLTDIDFSIVREEYTWESIEIHDAYNAKYAYLPDPLRELVRKLFTDKTSLKGIEEKELEYALSKELINALYGMCAQNPVKPDIIYHNTEEPFEIENEYSISEKLEKYNKRAFLLYAWACWVTSWARYKLKLIVNIVGDNFVYCDTDSCKFIKDESYDTIMCKIRKLNKQLQSFSEYNHGFAKDQKGNTHYLGVYEHDGSYIRFITLGAKKYAYEDERGLHITIAGVGKKKGAEELLKHGGLDALKIGFTFEDAGGTESVYNDTDYGEYCPDPEHPDKSIIIGRNIVIRPSTYTVGLTMEYLRVIDDQSLWFDFIKWTEHKEEIRNAVC